MVPPWLAKNPRAGPDLEFGREQQFVINPDGIPELCDMLTDCPKHKPTPLYPLPTLAAKSGLGEIRVKDESQRFGFGAFKALGGVIAVYGELLHALGEIAPSSATLADLMNGKHREITSRFTFATASSGNHGRSVAAGAKLFGVSCVVFLPKFTSAEKEAAIRARGAKVVRVDGDYDAAGRVPAHIRGERLDDHLGHLVGRLQFGATQRHARLLRAGARGGRAAMAPGPHARVRPGRRGRVPAALIGYLWAVLPERPTFIVVEPKSADCWFQSNAAGRPALASGDADTVMGGLACREISTVTWPIVGQATDWFMTIEEDEVAPARRLFAHPLGGDPAVASGPSGCAGLAGLMRVCADKSAFEALKLDRHSRVLLVNSEGNLGEQPA